VFDPAETPRVFALPPGLDFPAEVVAGLTQRLAGAPPEALARVEIWVNTRRMQRRMRAVFDTGPARLLPRIRVVTELDQIAGLDDLPPPEPTLRRRLVLTQLIAKLIAAQPDLAPRTALFDLADSLAALMDEMQGEGVPPEALAGIETGDLSGYWQRSLAFLTLIQPFFAPDAAPDPEARLRRAAVALAARWADAPPTHPVIVAGSTGSRGTTALFMRMVAALPQGALILPGFDFDMPGAAWRGMRDAAAGEDHPQFRFAALLADLGLTPDAVRPWTDRAPPSAARNRLISLSLRPAPVTDQWMAEGKRLTDLAQAATDMTLIEAPTPRHEAAAIALILREAAETRRHAALITPDRMLGRQVSAALDRWGIRPDDSAGRPLPLTAPGRFLRHVARLFGVRATGDDLIEILKHPLTATGADARGPHLLHSRDLELTLRRRGPAFPGPADLRAWGASGGAERQAWSDWIAGCLDGAAEAGAAHLTAHVARHIALAEALAAGPGVDGSGALWDEDAGRTARLCVEALRAEASHGGTLEPLEYANLFDAVSQRDEVRDAVATHPDIVFLGPRDTREQGADLVILGGLNDGVWPPAAAPDPWLNRKMRAAVGLLLPERRIGLAAHDYQQAVAARQVVLTRSLRDAEAQTVPSRWLNRLTHLMGGLPAPGPDALRAMRARGTVWLHRAAALDTPRVGVAPAPRPAPQPPVATRPKALSITEIQTLIRDPYAIYARRVLRLEPLDPMHPPADARLRGTVLHKVVEAFVDAGPVEDNPEIARARLLAAADDILAAEVPWPAAQRLWHARIARVADWFVATERRRQTRWTPVALERAARLALPEVETTLTGKIDRIDRDAQGRLAIYDYKTGSPPTPAQREHFDKQLLLAAVMAEAGGVDDLPAAPVIETAYIGLGARPVFDPDPVAPGQLADTRAELLALLAAYRVKSRGYTARRALERTAFGGAYDHLARFGEWDQTDPPDPCPVGPPEEAP